MIRFIRSTTLLLILLNPFLVILYITHLVRELDFYRFSRALIGAGVISILVFTVFAWLGDVIFSKVLQAQFASFQIFGGVVFLLIGLQFVFRGDAAIQSLRGDSEYLAGAIAMPVLIGPGTVSASVLAGEQLSPWQALLAIVTAVGLSVLVMIGLKRLHDWVKPRHERIIDRYTEITGRVMALVIGTFAIEMIMQGVKQWVANFRAL